ncbi:MAG: hypothetical protein EPO68_13935 [Planctomycetota bacterium]|nr:MAG: hypothetical protein EPO68_13935 [Planctomycetota bacterium]
MKAGTGKLSPLLAEDPRRPLVAVTLPDSDGAEPRKKLARGVGTGGMLLAPQIAVSPAESVGLALSNPAKALALVFRSRGPRGGRIVADADLFLNQFLGLVLVAGSTVDDLVSATELRALRVKAREAIEVLDRWAQWAMANRSGGDARAELLVPPKIATVAATLAQHGQRLRLFKRDADLANAAAAKKAPPPPNPNLPPLTDDQQRFRDIFLEQGPHDCMLGSRACEEFYKRTRKAIEESAFRTRIVPALKAWGLKNVRRKGYYFPFDAPARRRG